MRIIMESIFDIAYLVGVITIGIIMIINAKRNEQKRLFGVLTLILGLGDSFHLIPRVIALIQNTMEESYAALGFGKLVTSLTMTVFYLLLYHFMLRRYNKPIKTPLTFLIYTLAVFRLVLCILPQNAWMSADSPLSFGIYRNIPFTMLGILMIIFLFIEAQKNKDKAFRFAWLAVLLSFMFYIPVVIWADSIPLVGMLMLPKTVCYVWLVIMGYISCKE